MPKKNTKARRSIEQIMAEVQAEANSPAHHFFLTKSPDTVTNKHTREIAKVKRLKARTRDMGITTPFGDLPKKTKIALSTTGFDSHRSVSKHRARKSFSGDKRNYGHFSGMSGGVDPWGKRGLVERAVIKSHGEDT